MEIHYLNVDEGDCSIIKHDSGRITMIDICCGNLKTAQRALDECFTIKNAAAEGLRGNFNQKEHPINPLDWLPNITKGNIFRFVATHPDMDHLDGLKALFDSKFKPCIFWDTENDKEMDSDSGFGKYHEEDWKFYQKLHEDSVKDVTRLFLKENSKGKFYNQDDDSGIGLGDRITIISPSKEVENKVEETEKYNDISYVLLITTAHNRKILFCGDTEAAAWDIILKNHAQELSDIDILISPHHGRKSGGNDEYLDVLRPKISLLGNAKSKDIDYSAWNNRKLLHFTNNQLGSVIFQEAGDGTFDVYATCQSAVQSWRQANCVFGTEPILIPHPRYPAFLLTELK